MLKRLMYWLRGNKSVKVAVCYVNIMISAGRIWLEYKI